MMTGTPSVEFLIPFASRQGEEFMLRLTGKIEI